MLAVVRGSSSYRSSGGVVTRVIIRTAFRVWQYMTYKARRDEEDERKIKRMMKVLEKYMDTDVEYSYRASKGGHDYDVSMDDSLEFSFSMDDIGSNDAAAGNNNNNGDGDYGGGIRKQDDSNLIIAGHHYQRYLSRLSDSFRHWHHITLARTTVHLRQQAMVTKMINQWQWNVYRKPLVVALRHWRVVHYQVRHSLPIFLCSTSLSRVYYRHVGLY